MEPSDSRTISYQQYDRRGLTYRAPPAITLRRQPNYFLSFCIPFRRIFTEGITPCSILVFSSDCENLKFCRTDSSSVALKGTECCPLPAIAGLDIDIVIIPCYITDIPICISCSCRCVSSPDPDLIVARVTIHI